MKEQIKKAEAEFDRLTKMKIDVLKLKIATDLRKLQREVLLSESTQDHHKAMKYDILDKAIEIVMEEEAE